MGDRQEKEAGSMDRLLMAVGACGELPFELARDVVGSVSYAAVLTARMKKEGLAGCRRGGGVKGYVLHRKGKRRLEELYADRMRPFLAGDACLYPVKSELPKRIRLHRMAHAWVQMYRLGADVFAGEFPVSPCVSREEKRKGIYYSSVLVKRRIAKETGGSRACGVLDAGEHGFCVYHTMECLMKWMGRTEWTFRMRASQAMYGAGESRRLQALILAKDMGMLVRLLESDGGIKKELFYLDDAYEAYYYLPGLDRAGLQYRLLMEPVLEKQMEEMVRQALRASRETGPAYFGWLLDLWQIRRVRERILREGRGHIICLDYQAEALQAYMGKTGAVTGLDVDKVKRQLAGRQGQAVE